ncbi:MAG: YbaK/EbsC family protein [Cyanobacteria bacterium SIG29]|nr:YbaK/EbsC family protein [Cyanobacteria bacterium SIG29]
MAIEKVKEYFKQFNMEKRILEFPTSSETVELAAIAVGCEPKQITKTMSFLVEEKPILIAMAGDARISNPKFREKFNTKAKMIPFEQVEEYIGHAVGGVCPFAIKENVNVYLDVSLKRFKTIFPAAGSGNSAIELTIPEMEKYSNYVEWIDIAKDWE